MNRQQKRAAGSQTRKAVDKAKLKKISKTGLSEIVAARQELDFLAVQLEAAQAKLRLLVSKALKEADAPIVTNAVCLTCGTIHLHCMSCPVCVTE